MPSSFFARSGPLARTPSHRQQVGRRRLMVLCALAGLAIASGVVGSLVRPAPTEMARNAATSPFRYFPAQ